MTKETLSQVLINKALDAKNQHRSDSNSDFLKVITELGTDAIYATGTWVGVNFDSAPTDELPEIDLGHPLTKIILSYTYSVCALNDLSDYMNGGGNKPHPESRYTFLFSHLEKIGSRLGLKIFDYIDTARLGSYQSRKTESDRP